MSTSTKAANNNERSYLFHLDDVLRWRPHLQQRGYVVLTNVLSWQDVETVKDLMWADLEGAHRICRSDSSTWKDWFLPYHGIEATMAQTAGPWYVRGHINVKKAFSEIWETTDLITSMDAAILWRSDLSHGSEGLHLDQNPFKKPHLDCVQGMVPLLPVNQDVGGLQVIPSSHTPEAIKQYCEVNPEDAHRGDFLPIQSWRGDPLLLECAPGDLILWDSRTIHGGYVGPKGGMVDEDPHLTRMSITVAMTPRSWADQSTQEKRRRGFKDGMSFNHCPHEAGTSTGTICARRRKGYQPFELTESQQAVL